MAWARLLLVATLLAVAAPTKDPAIAQRVLSESCTASEDKQLEDARASAARYCENILNGFDCSHNIAPSQRRTYTAAFDMFIASPAWRSTRPAESNAVRAKLCADLKLMKEEFLKPRSKSKCKAHCAPLTAEEKEAMDKVHRSMQNIKKLADKFDAKSWMANDKLDSIMPPPTFQGVLLRELNVLRNQRGEEPVRTDYDGFKVGSRKVEAGTDDPKNPSRNGLLSLVDKSNAKLDLREIQISRQLIWLQPYTHQASLNKLYEQRRADPLFKQAVADCNVKDDAQAKRLLMLFDLYTKLAEYEVVDKFFWEPEAQNTCKRSNIASAEIAGTGIAFCKLFWQKPPELPCSVGENVCEDLRKLPMSKRIRARLQATKNGGVVSADGNSVCFVAVTASQVMALVHETAHVILGANRKPPKKEEKDEDYLVTTCQGFASTDPQKALLNAQSIALYVAHSSHKHGKRKSAAAAAGGAQKAQRFRAFPTVN
eukprot:g3682.t1